MANNNTVLLYYSHFPHLTYGSVIFSSKWLFTPSGMHFDETSLPECDKANCHYTGRAYVRAIAQDKIMIIDGKTLITGSFNFTKAAEEKDAENLLIIQDKNLAAKYIENSKNLVGHLEA
jgi:phosphatidylserine/phosphatidylglycerophosphate/cardiolipin synthase-like enzyme